MKAVIGILLIATGFFIDYLVLTNKLPPAGGIQPPVSNSPSSSSGLPTATSTSTSFAATSGQGSSGRGPQVGGRKF